MTVKAKQARGKYPTLRFRAKNILGFAAVLAILAVSMAFDYLGFDIFYRTHGSGPHLLLIHGYPFNTWDWEPLWPELTQHFIHVIAADMLGFGFSDKPRRHRYSLMEQAA